MSQGLSLHIGLNHVDPSKYKGWDGALAGCINDANAMRAIAEAQGFTATQLVDADATADNILYEIGRAAHMLESGDTFFVSYSGHGSQVPDANADEDDGLDETWVAYDRMVVDDELYGLWAQFAAGVRIQVFSDSCHSGTVIRDITLPTDTFQLPLARGTARNPADRSRGLPSALERFNLVYRAAAQVSRAAPAANVYQTAIRAMPPALAMQVYAANQAFYETRQFTNKRSPIEARVILISGCQDNQTSADGQSNGLFTEKLLSVWNNGAFGGTLSQFHKAILALMPGNQTPNYDAIGADDWEFDAARPMTLVTNSSSSTTPTNSSSGEPVPPAVQGPATFDRGAGDGPTFDVTLGSNRYYIFEITSDTENFGNPANRSESNFYGTWADPNEEARLTNRSYTLPRSAWAALSNNAQLYYRVGSTSSLSGWDNYLVSTTDADAASSAPSINIVSEQRSAPIARGMNSLAVY
jgi:hypothetical protein